MLASYHIVIFNTAFILFLYKVYLANKSMIEYNASIIPLYKDTITLSEQNHECTQ